MDHKNRLIIPSSLRQQLAKDGKEFVLTRGLEKSLFLYPLSEWKRLENNLKDIPTNQSDTRAFLRLLFSGAHPVKLDPQARITVPQSLKDFAGIKEKITTIGALNKIEIWAQDVWDRYYQEKRSIYEELSEKVMDVGI